MGALRWMLWCLMCCPSLALDTEEFHQYTLELQYTVQPGPDGTLHFHQTTVFKGEVIFHCNSTTLTDQPRQQWIQETFSQDERQSQDEYCRAQYYEHMQWFQEINQTINGTAEILQRRSGCKANGSGVFTFDKWAVNSEDFLTIDHEALRWIPASELAAAVALKWNKQDVGNEVRKHDYRHIAKRVCEKSQKFKDQIQTQKTDKGDMDIHMFLKNMYASRTSGLLTCHVIDSDLSGVRIQLTEDGVPLVRGVQLFGPRPNEDGTVQMRVQVQISLKDTKGYRCKVQRKRFSITVLWDGLPDKITVFPVSGKVFIYLVASLACFGVLVVNIVIHGKSLADRLCQAGGRLTSLTESHIKYLRYVETQEEFDEWAGEDDEYYVGNHEPA